MLREELKLLFITGSLSDKNSGVYTSVFHTAQALRAKGLDPLVLGDTGGKDSWKGVRTKAFATVLPKQLHYSPKLSRCLSTTKPFDIVSLQSPWLYNNLLVSRWCKQRGIPYMVTVHGSFYPKALKISAWKKNIAKRWFANRVLRQASCFQALTQEEYQAMRNFGIYQPICIIPNGVSTQKHADKSTLPDLGSSKLCLYLGRLHRIKGLDKLLCAWAKTTERRGWKLALVGPDDGYKDTLLALAKNLRLRESVVFANPANKSVWLKRANLSILPSQSEGFAIFPLEAMSFRVPVLLTQECHFPEAASAGAGYIVGCSANDLRKGLVKMMSISDADRKSMGEKGQRLVARNYGWSQIADKLLAVYEWMLGGFPPPWLFFD